MINRVDRPAGVKPAPAAERPVATVDSSTRSVSPLERALRSLMRERPEGRT
jgi:hypothetical protein